jgi:hypothetical protein
MWTADGSGWQVMESDGRTLVVPLYVRDACGLTGPDVPPLSPVVPVRDVPGAVNPSDSGRVWTAWWESALAVHRAGDPGELARGSGPDTRPAVDQPQMCASFGVPFAEVTRWISDRGRETISRRRQAPREKRLAVNRAVEDVEAGLRRPLGPLRLRIGVLPVAGTWSWRPAPEVLLVATDVREDAGAYRSLVRSVLTELAG